jgi:hypothetical protein
MAHVLVGRETGAGHWWKRGLWLGRHIATDAVIDHVGAVDGCVLPLAGGACSGRVDGRRQPRAYRRDGRERGGEHGCATNAGGDAHYEEEIAGFRQRRPRRSGCGHS